MEIQKFEIIKLYGAKNWDLVIKNNRLVIVAENGAGKTTVLRLLYLFLSKQWGKLIEYDFEAITATIDNVSYSFTKDEYDVKKIPQSFINLAVRKYPIYKDFLETKLVSYTPQQLFTDDLVAKEIESKYDVPLSLVYSLIAELSRHEFDNDRYKWQSNLLYLPTYRRIERDFNSLYGDISKRLEQMLRQTIPSINISIKKQKEESESGTSELENELLKIFDTLWQNRDFERWQGKTERSFYMELIEFGMDDVQFRISQIVEKQPARVQLFLEKCNKYLSRNKFLELSKSGKQLILRYKEFDSRDLNILSSGEKQIISLFSYLLDEPEKLLVFIDEPELSLSMSWQEMILTDIEDFKIGGLVVATHSPFVISENFKNITYGLDEFAR
ncbi:AAA family ATPase [Mucilaginibacter jinjuensis]|uniref:AAA family ATPase n=1 Tax=Mucilaginibacter jinjuensis TaxID=1176721 RepID=A0ABY7TB79_9SPHI|nr:AAA family ATPase [Mucilaginibacter jinjuensis]WCT13489.1 AAA family ATPase [Mucilaginibacter jinjuensis]